MRCHGVGRHGCPYPHDPPPSILRRWTRVRRMYTIRDTPHTRTRRTLIMPRTSAAPLTRPLPLRGRSKV